MAIYHLCARPPIARAAGRSTTAAAAYRSGTIIIDDRTGEIHDYLRRRGVVSTKLMLPGGAEISDRSAFWNRLEAYHKRGDAVLARELIVALPAELSADQRQRLVESLASEIANRYGVAVDLAIHAPSKSGDSRNHHAHILQTACHVDPFGTLGKKAVLLDPIHCARAKIEDAVTWVRPHWAALTNVALEASGSDERIDQRSHVELAIDLEPTVHIGVGPGHAARRNINESRRQNNIESALIDTQMSKLLRERALVAAVEKINHAKAKACADVGTAFKAADSSVRHVRTRSAGATHPESEISENRSLRSVAQTLDRAPDSEIQSQLVNLKRQRTASNCRAAELVDTLTKAIPTSVVKQALAELPSTKLNAVNARRAVARLKEQAEVLPWWRQLLRRTLAAELLQAESHARVMQEEFREQAKAASAPAREQIRILQDSVAIDLRLIDSQIAALETMVQNTAEAETLSPPPRSDRRANRSI